MFWTTCGGKTGVRASGTAPAATCAGEDPGSARERAVEMKLVHLSCFSRVFRKNCHTEGGLQPAYIKAAFKWWVRPACSRTIFAHLLLVVAHAQFGWPICSFACVRLTRLRFRLISTTLSATRSTPSVSFRSPVPRGKEGNRWCQTPVRGSLESRMACMHHSHRRRAGGAGPSKEQLRYMMLAGDLSRGP